VTGISVYIKNGTYMVNRETREIVDGGDEGRF
jgi:hypothetical protein